jgi:hypothetical protein
LPSKVTALSTPRDPSIASPSLRAPSNCSLRLRFREQGVDGALNETGWGLAYDFGAMAHGAGHADAASY